MILEIADNCGQIQLMDNCGKITIHTQQRAKLTRIQLAQGPAYLDRRGVDSTTKTFV